MATHQANAKWRPQWIMESPPGPEVVVNGRKYLYFGGTSYLGLHGNRKLLAASTQALKKFGLHPATSRARFGNNPPVMDVEREIARFFGTQEGFYFISGYVGNHILIEALRGSFDVIIADESGHFSGHEAARGSGCPVHFFRSRDAGDLRQVCRTHLKRRQKALVLTDAINPTTGDLAPLPEYVEVLKHFPGSSLSIDDAHGMGILGEKGRGTVEHFGLWDGKRVNAGSPSGAHSAVSLYVCGTLSKAFGGLGGMLPGSVDFLHRARRGARFFDAASCPDSAAAAASAAGLALVREQPRLRKMLFERVRWMKEGLRSLGVDVNTSPVPILGIDLGSSAAMKRVSESLRRKRIILPYVDSYSGTGPNGVLRLAIFSNHTRAMVSEFLDAFKKTL